MNFSIGPVNMHECTKQAAALPIPYFRTKEFSQTVNETTEMFREATNAPKSSEIIFLTASGTAAMEAAVVNCLSINTKVLVINGGNFGQRFEDLCVLHKIPHDVLRLPLEKDLTEDMLTPYSNKGYFALLVNIHETGIGKLYPAKLLSDFCQKEKMYFIVDAISSLFADEYDITDLKADITLVSSQKALALAPGLAIITISERMYNDVILPREKSIMYFDFVDYVANSKRGQTPFTPAVGIIFQLHARLKSILEQGVHNVITRTAELACYFRSKITEMPFEIPKYNLSNCITPVFTSRVDARQLFETLIEKHNIFITPVPPPLDHTLFRVGHIGNLNEIHYDKLLAAIKQELK